jgi:hypothetical protein
MVADQRTMIPIYNSRGDSAAFLIYPRIYNRAGEWIGFVTAEREVYSVHGRYVGWLTDDPRVLAKRSRSEHHPDRQPPSGPRKVTVPAMPPLAPLMSELRYDTIDVLLEEPELMPSLDIGEVLEDMD